MPKAVFHQRQQLGIVTRLGIEHPLGIETRLVKPGREQVAGAHDPQDRPVRPRRNAGHEQDGRGIIAPAGALPRNLVQRIQPEPLSGQPFIDCRDTEGQHGAATRPIAFDGAQSLTQFGNG